MFNEEEVGLTWIHGQDFMPQFEIICSCLLQAKIFALSAFCKYLLFFLIHFDPNSLNYVVFLVVGWTM